jgi:HSP20 family protein
VLTAELAGLNRSDIDIHAEDFRIVIRGARGAVSNHTASSDATTSHAVPGPRAGEVSSEQYHRVERGHGRFSRAFSLPEAIAVDRVSADLKDGILTVTMPKAGQRAVHRIEVT